MSDRACLMCAFAGLSKSGPFSKRFFMPHDTSVTVALCGHHSDADNDEIREAFLSLAQDAPIREVEVPDHEGGSTT